MNSDTRAVSPIGRQRPAYTRSAEAAARVAQLEQLVREVVQLSLRQVEEARLALHILQSNPFGELNENQEELVTAARSAMDTVDSELRTMGRSVSLAAYAGAAATTSTRLRPILDVPLAMAMGGSQAVRETVRWTHVDELPNVVVDIPAVQEALAVLLRDCVAMHPPGEALTISGLHTPPTVTMNIPMDTSVYANAPPLRFHLATALLQSCGVALTLHAGLLVLQFPEAP